MFSWELSKKQKTRKWLTQNHQKLSNFCHNFTNWSIHYWCKLDCKDLNIFALKDLRQISILGTTLKYLKRFGTTPSPRVTRILVPEKTRVMRKPRNAGSRCSIYYTIVYTIYLSKYWPKNNVMHPTSICFARATDFGLNVLSLAFFMCTQFIVASNIEPRTSTLWTKYFRKAVGQCKLKSDLLIF